MHALVPQGVLINDPLFIPGPGPTCRRVLDLIAGAAAVHPPGTWLFAIVGTSFSENPQAHRTLLPASRHESVLTMVDGEIVWDAGVVQPGRAAAQ